jgi:hypothetical protein
MDTFKIIVIIFLIMLSYQVYVLNKIFYESLETFSTAEQSIGGIDDANAINTLAQLAKQLMAGGATVPGNLSVKGEIDATGIIKANGVNILQALDTIKANMGTEINSIKNGLNQHKATMDAISNSLDDIRGKAVRKDAQYYIDIGVRANGDGCCGNGSGLIIHHAGPNGPAHAWSDKNVTTRFSFRQV